MANKSDFIKAKLKSPKIFNGQTAKSISCKGITYVCF